MFKEVPDSGLYQPLELRAAKTFGPFRVELADAALAPYALTGAALGGELWPRATPGASVPLTVQFSDGTATAVDFWLGDAVTAGFTGGGFFNGRAQYAYQVWYATPGGIKKTLVHGAVTVLANGPAL